MRTLLTILVLLATVAPFAFAVYRVVVSPAVRAVFLRNLKSYFSGILGYLFIVVFVILASLIAFNQQFFSNNLASLDQLSAWFPYLLLFLVPAITMAAWSDERKLGTDELLFTLPARDLDILIGKYLAVVAVYTITLAFSITNLYVLEKMGSPDWGPIFTTYFGYWLAGVALLAAGLLASSLTSSATVAFVLGAVVCAVPVFIDRMPRSFFGLFELPRDSIAQLSVGEQLRDFTLGMIPATGVLYFISFAALMLYLNYVVIRKRHWSGDEQTQMGLQYAVRAVSVAAALLGLNILAQGGSARADLTSDDIYSLAPTTRQVITAMDKDRPVTIQAFVSPEVPREFVSLRKQLTGLLRQYDQLGGAKIDVRIVDVEPFSEQAEEAKAFGIEPRQVMTERDGRQIREEVFLGIVLTSSFDEVVISSLGPGSLLEYELTRSLGTVSKADRLTVGVLETDAGLIGGQRDWEIVRELRLQYNVESVSPAMPIDAEKYDVLLAVMPSSLAQPEMDNFIAYVETGRPVLVFDDPYPFTMNSPGRISIAPRLPKPSPGGMMAQFNRQPPVPKAEDGRLTSLMRLLQMTWTHDAIVWDDYNPHPEFADPVPPEYLFIRNRSENTAALSPKSEITSGLQEILLAYAGEVRRLDTSKFEYTPLLVTGPVSGVIPWEEFAEQSFNPMTFSPDFVMSRRLEHIVDPAVHAVGAHIKGKQGEPNVVFVADIDIIADWFFEQRMQNSTLSFDNVTFVLNAVDVLAGDEAYLDLRKRRAKQRTLEEVEKQTAVFLQQLREREEEVDESLQKELEAVQQRFDAARKAIEEDTTLSARAREERLAMALQNEQLRLEVSRQDQEKKLAREKGKLKNQTDRQVRDTENKWWWRGVILPPLPAIILGLSVLLTRMFRERREVDPDRAVGR